MRAKRTELEKAVARIVTQPSPLRDAIRAALDKGASPASIRRRYGARGQRRHDMTALSIEFMVDEWEREKGLMQPDESIDRLEML